MRHLIISANVVLALGFGLTLALSFVVISSRAAQLDRPELASAHSFTIPADHIYTASPINTTAFGTGVAYVAVSNQNYLAVVDTVTHTVVSTISLASAGCNWPWQVAIPPDGETVWVACRNSDNLIVVDHSSNTISSTVSGVSSPQGLAFTNDGAYALVGSHSSNQVTVVDTTNYFMRFIYTPGPVPDVAIHPYLPRAYATNRYGNLISVIDTTAFSITKYITVSSTSHSAVIAPDGLRLYTTNTGDDSVSVIDTLTDQEISHITGLGSQPNGLDISPDGAKLFVTSGWSGTAGSGGAVKVINTGLFSIERTIAIDWAGNFDFAWGAELTCDGGELFVTNPRDEWNLSGRQVAVIDTTVYSITALISMPDRNGDGYPDWGARGIAVCPQYVATGVYLSPPSQVNQGGRGQVVAHQGRLINATGATDSFSLTLGSRSWDTALSASSLGPVASGNSVTFTVYVTVPVDAPWYSTDTVVVTATSVTSPTVYSDTATFTTQAYAPPQISVSPDVLTSTQYVNEIFTKSLTISNGNGVTLTFELAGGMTPIQNGLVAYYPFNGNANDESGNGNDGTIMGATLTADRFGNPDSACSFDGVDDFVEIPNSASLNISGPLTIDAWIHPDTVVGNHRIVGKGGWVPHENFLLVLVGNTLRFGLASPGGGSTEIDSTQTISAGVWTHVVGIFDGSTMRMYINGILDPTTGSHGTILTGSSRAWIGVSPDRSSFESFDGINDEVHIYNRALSEAEIRELYYWQGSDDAPWLLKDPISGTVGTNSSQIISVTFNSTGLQPGTYTTTIGVQSNDPAKPLTSIPVTMTVNPTANMGWVEGTVTDAATGAPLTAAIIALGQPYTVTTKPNGTYKLWLDAGSYTLQASATGYVTATALVSITAQQGITQGFALVLNVPRLSVSPESLQVTHNVGDVTTRVLTITNNGPAPLSFEIGSGDGVSFFAASTELYGYLPIGRLRIVGTQENTHVRVVSLVTGTITSTVIAENTDLDRYATWDVYPGYGTYYKVEADKPVVGYASDFGAYGYASGHDTFVPSLNSGPVGKEFIFYYHRPSSGAVYVFAIDNATVQVYDTSGNPVVSQIMAAGTYWDLSLSDAVYRITSTGHIAVEILGEDGYTTVPSAEGYGVGRRFYFTTQYSVSGACAVFAYQDADVNVYDLDTSGMLFTQHINAGNYWWTTGVGSRRLKLESTGLVEVWAGDAEGGTSIQDLGDDISFAGGNGGREYYVHSLMDGSVIFAPFDNTRVNVDDTVYQLRKDTYLYLSGCCYFRHIQSNQPILIQTLGRDSWWNNIGTYLGGVLAGRGGLPSWLVAVPLTGTVPAYSSVQVLLTFDAAGMQPGTYTAPVVVQSNDPVTPSVSVPVTMTINPTANMGRVTGAVSDAWTGQPLTATVELVGVYSTTANPNYTIWASAGTYSLTAYASGYYTVTRSATISAGGLVTVDLALEPAQPRLEWMPTAVSATAAAGSMVTRTLLISNTGPLPLEVALYEISPTVALQALASSDLTGKRILYDRAHGEPDRNDYSVLAGDVISAGAVITENWYYPIDATVLKGYDVLWVNCCGGTSWGLGELMMAVQDWLYQGGAVLVQGESSNATTGPAEFFGINYQSGNCTSGTTTNIGDHPISEGVSTVNVEWTCWRLAPGSGANIVVLDPQGQPHVVAQEQSGGKMVVVASEDFSNGYINNNDNRLLANNILRWLAKPGYGDVPWLSETPVTATILGHSSLPVTLGFDATALSIGDYQATLALEHNASSRPSPVQVPITLTVVGRQAALSLTPARQEGSGRPGETVVYTFTVTNDGNYTDTFNLTASGVWTPTLSLTTTGPLGMGRSFAFTLGVAIPVTITHVTSDTTTTTARSAFDPGVSRSAQAVTTAVGPYKVFLPIVLKSK